MTSGSPIERACALARSGQCRSVSEIIRRLPKEDRQSVEDYLTEIKARRELILICSEAWLATQ